MTFEILFGFCMGGLVGWIGGYCYGWLMGVRATELRWHADVMALGQELRK